jgi:hypothetical protein
VILVTLAIAFTTYLLANKVIMRRFLLYGRAKFVVMVLISAVLQAMALRLSPSGPWLWESDVPLLVGVGYVVPALIAHDMGRQGRRRTIWAVMVAGVVTAVPVVIAILAGLPGVNDLAPLVGYGVMAVDPEWVPVAVVLSALAAWGLQHNHTMRSGGFVGAAYIGLLGARPLQSLFLVAVAIVVYLLVTRALMPWMILFGRRKFAAMLLLSALVSWSCLWFGQALLGMEVAAYMSLGSVALMPLFVPGLIANDMERAGPARTLAGLSIGAAFVVPATGVVQAVAASNMVPVPLLVVAVVAGSVVFSRQIGAVGLAIGRRMGLVPAAPVAAAPRAPVHVPVPATEGADASPPVEEPSRALVG